MKIKLKNNEMQALHALLQQAVEQYSEQSMHAALKPEDALIKACLEEMWVKLDEQSSGIAQDRYTVKIKPHWAFAIMLQFKVINYASYAGNVMHRLRNDIDRFYA